MDKALSKTAAIREAQSACGKIHRRSSTDYVCYVPYHDHDPSGPSTEVQRSSYPHAVAARSRKVARIALNLMGVIKTNEDAIEVEWQFERACSEGSSSARDLVEIAASALKHGN